MRRLNRFCGLYLWLLLLTPTLPLSGQTINYIANTAGYTNFGQVGDLVNIWGNSFNFTGGFYDPVVSVKFNGVSATSGGVVSDSQIQVLVPAGATTGPVTVQKASGPLVSSPEDFVVIGPGPYVDSFTPTAGGDGTPVHIRGAHLGSVTAVKFNGASTSNFSSQSDTLIIVAAPAGVTTGFLTLVSSIYGDYITTEKFYAPPQITGFTPTSGSPFETFTITGHNFTDATAVTLNGVNAAPFTVNSNTEIEATVPLGATTGKVRVTTPFGPSAPSAANFTVLPWISGFTPPGGDVGSQVVISGANLNVSPVSVRFNGVQATVNSTSYGQITVVAPASSSGHIEVTTGDGTTRSAGVFYYPPNITGLSPEFGPAGTSVNISGSSFTNASVVLFDGTPAASFVVNNNNLIVATAPEGVSSGFITVQAPGGVDISSDKFYAPATLTSFLPTQGTQGTDVTVFGDNFDGVSRVQFNGVTAPVLTSTETQIGTRVPSGATTGPITVTTPAGPVVSAASFTVLAQADLRTNSLLQDPNPVSVGDELTLDFIPSNDGPDTALDVTASVLLASGMNLKSAYSTSPGVTVNTNGNPVVFTIGSMTLFSNPKLTLVLVPQTAGSKTTTVTFASSTSDPNPGNNTGSLTTTVIPVPELAIRRQGPTQVRIAWPAALSGFVLQSSGSVAAGATWSTVGTTPTVVDDEKVVIVTTSTSPRFYRLKK